MNVELPNWSRNHLSVASTFPASKQSGTAPGISGGSSLCRHPHGACFLSSVAASTADSPASVTGWHRSSTAVPSTLPRSGEKQRLVTPRGHTPTTLPGEIAGTPRFLTGWPVRGGDAGLTDRLSSPPAPKTSSYTGEEHVLAGSKDTLHDIPETACDAPRFLTGWSVWGAVELMTTVSWLT